MLTKKDLSAIEGMFEKNNAILENKIIGEVKKEIRANTGELIELISAGFKASASNDSRVSKHDFVLADHEKRIGKIETEKFKIN